MSKQPQREPTAVPETAKRVGETRWKWVERAVWSERMLRALGNGVKGGKWYSLMDKVLAPKTLELAFRKVKANRGSAGVDGISIARFEKYLEKNLRKIHEELRAGTFQPLPIKRTWIDKPGSKEKRPLGIPTVRDRVVQTALKLVLEPIFEQEFIESSHGFRPNRGTKDALRMTNRYLKGGYRWVVDADFSKFFDTIPKDRLMDRVTELIADGKVLTLIRSYLDQRVMEEGRSWVPEAGTPQGAIISPMLANLYLNPLDHQMMEVDIACVRYADDLVILCKGPLEAQAALNILRDWSEQQGLSLHPEKTRLVDMTQPMAGFDFLGYHFQVSKKGPEIINRWPSMKSKKRLRAKIRPYTKRANGHSMEAIIGKINPILKGWFEHFKHSRRNEFPSIDGWIRMRLRSILRKRRKLRGKGRGSDHQRWPNAYFSALGLFSTENAHRVALARSRSG